ncbi:MAG: glycosyltransferase family 2 protein [Phycisphaerales bacterium]
MVLIAEILLWGTLAVLAIPAVTFAAEVLLALLPGARPAKPDARPTSAVLIPAHDESGMIGPTVRAVRDQLESSDRVVVVADNCSDATAEEARDAGAMVVERVDPARRGKGYALAAGLDALRADPPGVVLIIDADCTPDPGALDVLVRGCWDRMRPVQAAYLMRPPLDAGVGDRVSALAFRFKNHIRPRGLARAGAPCLLTGSGMAFPFEQLAARTLATDDIVEDMRLGVELAIAGHAPAAMPGAVVTSDLPGAAEAKRTQRTRWEHGHLASMARHAPRLVWASLVQRRVALLALALELAVPPMSLLLLLLAGFEAICIGSWLLGVHGLPAIGGGALLALCASAALLGWARFGRGEVRPADLLFVPFYAASKVPIYVRAVTRRQRAWVRTARDPQDPDACTR